MNKHGRKNPKQELSDRGPLAWLAGFTSFGLDSRTPRPPFPKIHDSRFLGLDARRKGYTIDMKRPYTIQPFPADPADPYFRGHAEILTQRHRGTVKACIRLEEIEELIPLPTMELPEVDLAVLSSFLAEWPPRPIMQGYQSSAEAIPPWQPLPEKKPRRPTTEESAQVVRELLEVQQFVRSSFLHPIWLREQHQEEKKDGDWRLKWTIFSILKHCLLDANELGPFPAPTGPYSVPLSQRDTMLMAAYSAEWIVRRLRAPVVPIMAPWSLDLIWVGNGYPGIIWAEVLNAFLHDRASWPLLRCCGWCGRFFTASPAERGRPREFCTDPCRKRFHDYGPHDRRTAHITQ